MSTVGLTEISDRRCPESGGFDGHSPWVTRGPQRANGYGIWGRTGRTKSRRHNKTRIDAVQCITASGTLVIATFYYASAPESGKASCWLQSSNRAGPLRNPKQTE